MLIPIDAIVSFDSDGNMIPTYFSYTDEFKISHTYKIDKILEIKNERFAGIYTILFTAIATIEGNTEEVILKYFIKDMKWKWIINK